MRDSIQWNQEQVGRFAAFFTAPPSVRHFELVAEISNSPAT